MTASTEGTDLLSWIENRRAFREKVRSEAAPLEECRRRLVSALGKRQADPAVTFDEETIEEMVALTEEAVTALRAAEKEWSQIMPAREAAKSALQSTRAELERAAQQRAQKEAEHAAQRKHAADKRQVWMKRIVLRFAAIGVLSGTFYVLYNF